MDAMDAMDGSAVLRNGYTLAIGPVASIVIV
jgi:hypothetical protein